MTLPITFANLNSPVPLAYLDTNFQYLDNASSATYLPSVSNIRLLTASSKSPAYVTGYASTGDGGQGWFWYNSADTTTADNGGTVLVSTVDGSRWYRFYEGPVSAAWFGYVANANPSTHVSVVAGQGTVNVTAINASAVASWKNLNYPAGVAGGGYGGAIHIPGGYGELAGSLPIIINPANRVYGDGQHITFLCPQTTFNPSVTMNDGSTLYLGAVYFDVVGSPYSAVPGYPTGIQDLSIVGNSNLCSGIVTNSNTAFIKNVWIAGFASGISLANTNTELTDVCVEQNSVGITLSPFANGNNGKGIIINACTSGFAVNNRKWYSIATSASNAGGASPVLVVAASQGLNTGYTFNGNAVPAAVYDGMQVTVMAGTGKGQTGVVKTGGTVLNGSWQFVLTLTSGSGSWTAVDATSQVVIYNANSENTFSNVTMESITYSNVYAVGAYGFRCQMDTSQSTTVPTNGCLYVTQSEDITIDANAKASLDYRYASTTANGAIIGASNKNIRLRGQYSGWANGVYQGAGCLTDGLYLDNLICTGNSANGATQVDGLKTVITGGLYANNGSSGTAGTGLNLTIAENGASITVAGALADSFVNGVAGYQATGLNLVSNASSGIINVTGTTSLNHTTNIAIGGTNPQNVTIDQVGRNSMPTQSVASAAALAVPALAVNGILNVTGTTNITSVTGLSAGSRVTLIFAGILTLTKGTHLNLTSSFTTTAGSSITLVSDGTTVYEAGRCVE